MSGIVPVKYIEDGNGVIHPIQITSYIDAPSIELQKHLDKTIIDSQVMTTKQLIVIIKNKPIEAKYLALEQLVGRNSSDQKWVELPYDHGDVSNYSLLPSYKFKLYHPLVPGTNQSYHYFYEYTGFPYPIPMNNKNNIDLCMQTHWDITETSTITIDILDWVWPIVKPFAKVFDSWATFKSELGNLYSEERDIRIKDFISGWENKESWSDLQTEISNINETLYPFKSIASYTKQDTTTQNEITYYIIWNWDTPLPLFTGEKATNIVNIENGTKIETLRGRNLTFRFQLQDEYHHSLGVHSSPFLVRGNGVRSCKDFYNNNTNLETRQRHKLWQLQSGTNFYNLNKRAISIQFK